MWFLYLQLYQEVLVLQVCLVILLLPEDLYLLVYLHYHPVLPPLLVQEFQVLPLVREIQEDLHIIN